MSPPLISCPVLDHGDHLSRDEFERLFTLRTDLKKAELIRGVVYVPSPARATVHAEPAGILAGWLDRYVERTPRTRWADSPTVRLSADSEPMPDLVLFFTDSSQVRISADDYLTGAPELVIEVAASSASYDVHEKLEVYREAGVLEYLVWRTLDGAVDWLRLEDGEYRPITPDPDGRLESQTFPGLRLNVSALLAGARGQALYA
jgi:Uma2 family endonuclease